MAPFAGFEMPIQYSGLVDEHRAVRSAAGLFDVSHMGEFFLGGRQAGALLDELTPSNISVLPAGRAQYTALTTERGTFVDDVLVYRLAEDGFLVVVNAANIAKDCTWIESRRDGFDVRFEDRSDATALLALQGPLSKQILAPIVDGFDAQRLKYYRVSKGRVAGRDALVSRTGYT
ncbi:MAG: glycine cleavage system aminomethyltransferase GcvT, partial [Acidobacteriota bacterium]